MISIENRPVNSVESYKQVLRDYPVGSTIHVSILRKGKTITAAVETKAYPEDRALELAYNLFGIRVKALSEKYRRNYRIAAKKGVVSTEVMPQAYLAKIGVEPGDVIRQMDDVAIDTLDAFKKAMIKHRQKETVVFLVQRGEQGYYISVKL